MKYWNEELGTKGEATREIYLRRFNEFLEYTGKTPDELIQQRQENLASKDLKIQRAIESEFMKFLALKKHEGYAPATLQIMFASIRSFFEIHYYPLRMRRGDYPKGDSNGVKRASKEAIQKALDQKSRNRITINAMILFLKDSGLRVSDARLLNYGNIAEQLERNEEFISITMVTQKTKLLVKTIGKEAIGALETYIEARKKGSQNVTPEIITDKSPLFRTWEHGKVKRIARGSFSSLIRQTFLRVNEQRITAHSLRKYLQTNLECAGVNTNWIDQILGHELINSRDAYSQPTDEELKEAYMKAYKYIKVYPEVDTEQKVLQPMTTENPQVTENQEYKIRTASNLNEVIQLMQQGYQYADTVDGTRIYKKQI